MIGQGSPLARIRAGVDSGAFTEATSRGRAMTPEQAVDFVLQALAGSTRRW